MATTTTTRTRTRMRPEKKEDVEKVERTFYKDNDQVE